MKTTGVKDVPKKILLVFLGHPNVQGQYRTEMAGTEYEVVPDAN